MPKVNRTRFDREEDMVREAADVVMQLEKLEVERTKRLVQDLVRKVTELKEERDAALTRAQKAEDRFKRALERMKELVEE